MEHRHISIVHVAKKQLGLDDDVYRDILQAFGGTDSAKNLSHSGFRAVMERFKELGFESRVAPSAELEGDMITPKQQRYIMALMSQVGFDTTQRKVGWIKRQLQGRAWPQTTTEANAIIEALKKMVRRGYLAKEGES
jgi:phage gp16-like protein